MKTLLNIAEVKFTEEKIENPRSEGYLKVNPQGLVPSLKVGPHVLVESSSILRYIAS